MAAIYMLVTGDRCCLKSQVDLYHRGLPEKRDSSEDKAPGNEKYNPKGKVTSSYRHRFRGHVNSLALLRPAFILFREK